MLSVLNRRRVLPPALSASTITLRGQLLPVLWAIRTQRPAILGSAGGRQQYASANYASLLVYGNAAASGYVSNAIGEYEYGFRQLCQRHGLIRAYSQRRQNQCYRRENTASEGIRLMLSAPTASQRLRLQCLRQQ